MRYKRNTRAQKLRQHNLILPVQTTLVQSQKTVLLTAEAWHRGVHPLARAQVCISTKGSSITPSPGFSLQNPETILGEEKDASNATRGNFINGLFRSLRQRNKGGDLVVDLAGKENAKVAWRISV